MREFQLKMKEDLKRIYQSDKVYICTGRNAPIVKTRLP